MDALDTQDCLLSRSSCTSMFITRRIVHKKLQPYFGQKGQQLQ